MTKDRKLDIGGQAVIEGVMMKYKNKLSVAVRREDGTIVLKKETLKSLPKILKLPLIRGFITLIYIMIIGIKALIWSANQSMGEDEEFTMTELVSTLAFSFTAALVFFLGIPFFATKLINLEGIWFNVVEGIVRLVVFVGYVYGISFMKDVKRMFQYHGAEHMAATCYEHGEELTVKNVRKFSTIHPRCGTSFIMLVMIVSIILFSFITTEVWHQKLLWRLLFIPLVSGVSYEILRLGGKYQESLFMRIIIAPGRWVQKITTQDPEDGMIEVAIVSLNGVLEE